VLAGTNFFSRDLMALYYDLKVFKDVYQLILKVFEYTKDFPREYKYTLGQDMKRDAIVLVRSIYRANKAKSKTIRKALPYLLLSPDKGLLPHTLQNSLQPLVSNHAQPVLCFCRLLHSS